VPRPDFEAFLGSKFAESGFKVQNPSAISLILDLAEDVPYNVQMLAHSCWDQLRDRVSVKSAVLTEVVVRQALELLVRQYDPFYTQLWTALTSIQQRTLLAVVEQRGVKLQSMKVVRSLGKGPSTVRRSLGALIDRNILREEESGNGIRMRFEDPSSPSGSGYSQPSRSHLLTLHGPPEDCSFDRYLRSTTNNVKNNNLENERRPEAEGHDGLGGNDDVAIAGVGACDCAGTRT
jgi:hypothetical protein